MSAQAFGRQLRRWRIEAGLRQEDVAEALGDVTQQTYSRWEQNGIGHTLRRFRQFEKVFKLRAGAARTAWVEATERDEDAESLASRMDRVESDLRRLLASGSPLAEELQAEIALLKKEIRDLRGEAG